MTDMRSALKAAWRATDDGTAGKGTGRHIACFIFEPKDTPQ